jgi:hypothetical protein
MADLGQAVGRGSASGVRPSGSHGLARPPATGKVTAPSPLSRETATWAATQATLVMMPVFVVALTNPVLAGRAQPTITAAEACL